MVFENYKVKPEDTLISIAMKFDMSIYYLLRINKLAEVSEIHPDMILKVKQRLEARQSSPDLSNISKERKEEQKIPEKLFSCEGLYCTSEAEVLGEISLYSNRMRFCPRINGSKNLEIMHSNRRKIIPASSMQVSICFRDVINCNQYELPSIDEDEPPIYFIQLYLSKTGKTEVDSTSKFPKWYVNFKIISTDKTENFSSLKQKATSIVNFIKNTDKLEDDYKTFVPYFDKSESILEEAFNDISTKVSYDNSLEKEVLNMKFEDIQIEGPEEMHGSMPEMSEKSSILNENMIKQIVRSMPELYQLRN